MDRHLSSPDVIASLQQGRFLVVGRAGMDLYPEPAGTRITEALSFVADLGWFGGEYRCRDCPPWESGVSCIGSQ